MNIFRKKGQISNTVIGLILLLVSLAIIIAIFVNLNSSVSVDREACHTSVVLKGTVPDIGGANVKNAISLNCQTKKLCISALSKGNCSDQFGKSFETLTVTGTTDEKGKAILQAVAREMADCWNMMGEGKLSVFSREVSSNDAPYAAAAVICTRIVFDNSITGNIGLVGPRPGTSGSCREYP